MSIETVHPLPYSVLHAHADQPYLKQVIGMEQTSALMSSAIAFAAVLAGGLIANVMASANFAAVSCLWGIGSGPAPAL